MVVTKNLFPQASSLLQAAVADVYQREGGAVLADMQQRTPVATGELRGSETMTVSGQTVTWTASADHALFVEGGTRFMGARPYLAPAVEAGAQRIADGIAAAVGSLGG